MRKSAIALTATSHTLQSTESCSERKKIKMIQKRRNRIRMERKKEADKTADGSEQAMVRRLDGDTLVASTACLKKETREALSGIKGVVTSFTGTAWALAASDGVYERMSAYPDIQDCLALADILGCSAVVWESEENETE